MVNRNVFIRAAILLFVASVIPSTTFAQTKLLRFPDIEGEKVVFTYGGDLWTASISGGTAIRLTAHPGIEVFGKFSPDGKWIAYHATAENTPYVYVVPFPTTGERWQISTRGGVQPRWRGDGRELYYLDTEGQLMRVEMPGGDPRQAKPAETLFRTTLQPSSAVDQFTASVDGQRFVLRRPVGELGTDQAPLTVIVNWRGLARTAR